MIDLFTSMIGTDSAYLQLIPYLTGAFIIGGIVKGTLGVGLPLVMVPLLSLVIPAPQAISLVVIPVFASNFWQALDSGASISRTRRFMPLILVQMLTTLITVRLALAMPVATLNAMVALAVLLAVTLMVVRPQVQISQRGEKTASMVVGGLAGILGGVSSLTGPIIISYLTALRLARENFVSTVSIIYLFAAVPLYGSMAWYGKLGMAELLVSVAGLIPMAFGMGIGKWLRGKLSELWFRRALLVFLCAIALTLLGKALNNYAQ